MNQLRCHILTIIVLIGSISFFSITAVCAQSSEIEVHGQIGGKTSTTGTSSDPMIEADSLAQPQQTHIVLKKFPNTGSVVEKLMPIGLLAVLLYFLLKKREAHRRKNIH